jgi:hypothetical protein
MYTERFCYLAYLFTKVAGMLLKEVVMLKKEEEEEE